MEFINNVHGVFLGSFALWVGVATALLFLCFGFWGAPFWMWSLVTIVALLGFKAPLALVGIVAAFSILFIVKPIRAALISSVVMKIMKAMKLIPQISQTERTALEAGVVWVEQDLFSGQPNFNKIMSEDYPDLTAEEQAFVDGPVEEVCAMADDWDIHQRKFGIF